MVADLEQTELFLVDLINICLFEHYEELLFSDLGGPFFKQLLYFITEDSPSTWHNFYNMYSIT